MIKDLSIIREHLEGYVEIEMPYDFIRDCHVCYITCELDENNEIIGESFFPGGKFKRKCNDIIFLQNGGPEKRVSICKRNNHGEIIYQSRFFIKENNEEKEQLGGGKNIKKEKDLEETINYQQNIIEKLIERIKEIEIQKNKCEETISTYEELLQENRYKLKELSIQLREKTNKLDHYEELIPKLYNSR